jgi:hypothetical protein
MQANTMPFVLYTDDAYDSNEADGISEFGIGDVAPYPTGKIPPPFAIDFH